MTIASPTQVTAPPSVLQAQPSTTYAAPPSSVAYAPPPSSAAAPVDLANPANFGLPAGNYAPPPSFTNGSVAQYTAPPSSLATTSTNTNGTTNGKPAALNMASTYNGSSIGLISPPPSSSNGNPFTPSTAYAPPPRTTSSSSVSNQARLTLMQNPGMTIDGSTRPSELIDDHAKTNGATSPSQDSTNFMENYVVQPGSEASVSPQPAGG